MHNKLCRNNFKSPYDFLSHRLHNRTADWAGTFIFTQLMRRDGHFDIFRKLVQNKCTLLLSRLGFRDCRCLLLNLFKMSVDFRLVEKHGHLTNDFFGCSFVLGTEVVLVQNLELLLQPSYSAVEPFVFLLKPIQPVIFRTGDCNHLRGSCSSGHFIVFHGTIVP